MHSDQSHINSLPLGKQSWAAADDKWVYEGDNLAIKIYTAINICWADFIAEKQTQNRKNLWVRQNTRKKPQLICKFMERE